MEKVPPKKLWFLWLKILLIILLGIFLVLFFYFFILLKPSNIRNWEYGFEVLPKITINGDQVIITDLRDFTFEKDKIIPNYKTQTVDINKLQRSWFVFEPFKIKPFTSFNGVAHTYFVFDFEDSEPIVVSVEARREKGEKYDAWVGAFNQFELIYVWGTERDETIRRVVVENNPLYMYPLTISQSSAKKLFLEVAKTTHELETKPRYYNTFFSNCTNELAKIANQIKPNSIPFNIALFLPGYSIEKLYQYDYIPNNQPIEVIKQKYYISDLIRNLHDKPDFSKQLREHLSQN